MNNNLRKIGIILIVVIVVPALLFITFELSSLNNNEKVIEKIYESQLDAILFSVNQYSQDVMDSWASGIETELVQNKNAEDIKDFISKYNSIDGVLICNIKTYKILNSYEENQKNEYHLKLYNSLIASKKDILNRLIEYQKSGYRKLEPIYADSTRAIYFYF